MDIIFWHHGFTYPFNAFIQMDADLQESPKAPRRTNLRTGILWNHLLIMIMYNTSTQIIKISHNETMLEVPKTTPRFAYSLGKSAGPAYSCSHTGDLLQWKDESKISKQKMCMWPSGGNQAQAPKGLSLWHYQDVLKLAQCHILTTHTKWYLLVSVWLDSVPVFLWHAGHKQHLPHSMSQSSRFAEEKQTLHINPFGVANSF